MSQSHARKRIYDPAPYRPGVVFYRNNVNNVKRVQHTFNSSLLLTHCDTRAAAEKMKKKAFPGPRSYIFQCPLHHLTSNNLVTASGPASLCPAPPSTAWICWQKMQIRTVLPPCKSFTHIILCLHPSAANSNPYLPLTPSSAPVKDQRSALFFRQDPSKSFKAHALISQSLHSCSKLASYLWQTLPTADLLPSSLVQASTSSFWQPDLFPSVKNRVSPHPQPQLNKQTNKIRQVENQHLNIPAPAYNCRQS